MIIRCPCCDAKLTLTLDILGGENEEESNEWKDILIDDLEIATRAKRAIWRGGYKTVGEVDKLRNSELLCLPEFGRKSLDEVREAIEELKRDAER